MVAPAVTNEKRLVTLVAVDVYRLGTQRLLRGMSNFPKIVELRGRSFTPPYPADTIVEVTSLYSPEALIEIEAIAVADEAVERT
jgi:enamine deaminase RidA (YjgF/YER057c/UK114 family)